MGGGGGGVKSERGREIKRMRFDYILIYLYYIFLVAA